jgi:hypothetical protein
MRVNKLETMKRAGHEARMEKTRMQIKFQKESINRRDQLEELTLEGRKILKWILKEQDVKMRT